MLESLAGASHVVGAKQTRRAMAAGQAKVVFVAQDADPALTQPLAQQAREAGLAVESGFTMAQLGRACGIAVGAACCAILI